MHCRSLGSTGRERLQKALRKREALLDALHDRLPEAFDAFVPTPKSTWLRMFVARSLGRECPGVFVVPPQLYRDVEWLDRADFFHAKGPYATTGSGSDEWLRASPALLRWTERTNRQMARLLARASSHPL